MKPDPTSIRRLDEKLVELRRFYFSLEPERRKEYRDFLEEFSAVVRRGLEFGCWPTTPGAADLSPWNITLHNNGDDDFDWEHSPEGEAPAWLPFELAVGTQLAAIAAWEAGEHYTPKCEFP